MCIVPSLASPAIFLPMPANQPPEDLIIAARKLAADYHRQVNDAWVEPDVDAIALGTRPAWRLKVPPVIRRMWGRLSYESRLTAFVVAASEEAHDWE